MEHPTLRRRRLAQIGHAVVLLVASFALFESGRVLTLALSLVALVVVCVQDWNRPRVLAPLWLALVGSAFLPFDVSLENRPGPPRFVPLVMGLVLHRDVEAIYGKEYVMGSCVSTGREPKWVLVW